MGQIILITSFTSTTIDNAQNPHDRFKLEYVVDGSGMCRYNYGDLGVIEKMEKTIIAPGHEERKSFVQEFRYDSWSRIDTLIYPDGEIVEYHYDRGGEFAIFYRRARLYFVPGI